MHRITFYKKDYTSYLILTVISSAISVLYVVLYIIKHTFYSSIYLYIYTQYASTQTDFKVVVTGVDACDA